MFENFRVFETELAGKKISFETGKWCGLSNGSVVVRYDRSNPLEKDAVKMGRIVRVFVNGSGEVDLNGDFVCDSPLNKKIKENQILRIILYI